jgi:hypothetical protein
MYELVVINMLNGLNYLLKMSASVRIKFTAVAQGNIEERQVCWRGTMIASPAVHKFLLKVQRRQNSRV